MGSKEELGLRIRTMRQSRRMTQADLAKSIRQSPSSITMYETGRREPDFETLEALADVFNVPMSAFLPAEDKSEEGPGGTTDKPKTVEAQILARGIDQLPQEKREQALAVIRAMFTQHADLFKEDE